LLVRYFAERFAQHLNRPVAKVTVAALERLQRYNWPGNVRELEHLVERAVLLCRENTIEEADVAGALLGDQLSVESRRNVSPEEYERQWLENALKATNYVIRGPHGAVQLLEIHPEKLRSRMRKHGLSRPR
jgi:DNA-binding NtrC family response regulator